VIGTYENGGAIVGNAFLREGLHKNSAKTRVCSADGQCNVGARLKNNLQRAEINKKIDTARGIIRCNDKIQQ